MQYLHEEVSHDGSYVIFLYPLSISIIYSTNSITLYISSCLTMEWNRICRMIQISSNTPCIKQSKSTILQLRDSARLQDVERRRIRRISHASTLHNEQMFRYSYSGSTGVGSTS